MKIFRLNFLLRLNLFTVSAASLVAVLLSGVPLAGSAADRAAGDASNGKALFERRCTGCHSLDNDREGPRLRGVYGRAAGSIPGFPYSEALKSAHLAWNDDLLDKWLTDTDALIPGNEMDFRVPRPAERADIIAFLRKSAAK